MRRAKDRGPPRGGASRPLLPAAPTRSRLPKESSSPRSGPVSVPWWPASLENLLDLYPPRSSSRRSRTADSSLCRVPYYQPSRPPYRSPYCWSPPLRLVHALHTAAEGKRRLLWRSPRPIRRGATLFTSLVARPSHSLSTSQEGYLSVPLLWIVSLKRAFALIKFDLFTD